MPTYQGVEHSRRIRIAAAATAVFLWACGPAVPPPETAAQAESSSETAIAESLPPAPKSGIHAVYVFKLKESDGMVSLWADGPFLRVEQVWRTDATAGRRWGAEQVILLFNADEQQLAVVNLGQKRYTRLDEARVERARTDLAAKQIRMPAVPGSPPSEPVAEEVPALPKTVATAKRPHPDGCVVYHRDLPFGLEEESCFEAFDKTGIAADAATALVAFGAFVHGIETRIPELGSVTALADAMAFDFGLLKSQHKFGISLDIDQEAEEEGGMASWDRIITLQSAEPFTMSADDIALPEDVEEAFGLVPWYTPFFDDNGPRVPLPPAAR